MSWITLFSAVLVALAAGSENTNIYKEIGDQIVLKPPTPPTSPITSVLWKHNSNLAVEWDGENTEQFSHFEGKSGLNSSTGVLTIQNLTRHFNGDYTVEINGHVLNSLITLQVISPVPKPSISKSCNEDMTLCTLTCEGNIPAKDPTPTCIWKFNNTAITTTIMKITPESTADEFICELQNPVSNETSEPFANPFHKRQVLTENEESDLKINKGIIVFVCLVGGVVAIVLAHRVKAGMWFFQKDSMPWDPDFWRKTARQAQSEPEPVNEEPERNRMMEQRNSKRV